jgi:hypothetical protein
MDILVISESSTNEFVTSRRGPADAGVGFGDPAIEGVGIGEGERATAGNRVSASGSCWRSRLEARRVESVLTVAALEDVVLMLLDRLPNTSTSLSESVTRIAEISRVDTDNKINSLFRFRDPLAWRRDVC